MNEQMKKKIFFITGTRADFGKIKSLIKVIDASSNFEYIVFATGMHLLQKYGVTLHEIEKEHFKNVFLYFNQTDFNNKSMDIILAETIRGLSYYLSENKVDMIVVHGDRIEALAAATVGMLQGIKVVHIEGGECTGGIDEQIRHAITKLAHVHFVATEKNKKRLLQLGEEEKNIYIIGSPNIDIMLSNELPTIEEVKKNYDIFFDHYSLLIYHPVVTEKDFLLPHITEVVEAIKAIKDNFIVIHPNNDYGSDIILNKILELSSLSNVKLYSSMRFERYLTVLKNAKCIIGNSSSGIHEAPIYGVPTINIGIRQQGRFSHESIVNVTENKEEIIKAYENLPERFAPIYTYGSGDSAKKFYEIISSEEFWQVPLQKNFIDL